MLFQIRVRGIVQGVGFRPTVWRLARDLCLQGEVLNDAEGVLIRIDASEAQAQALVTCLRANAPPLSRIDTIDVEVSDLPEAFSGFSIRTSVTGVVKTIIGPDVATCARCAAELVATTDRRYRYPFANCTNCGPRFSIVERIPYDRANTSMAAFAMCATCRAEYADPRDRRFHAEPIACPACGPRLSLTHGSGNPVDEGDVDVIETAVRRIGEGRIIAVKGLGGYHIACDATNRRAVDELRRRKQRSHKPFALMARDLDVVRRYACVGAAEESVLASAAAPVLLLEAGGTAPLPEAIAPGLSLRGFMLPYTPLHRLLLHSFDKPLVMTSGNLSDEPQCIDDDDARQRLAPIADLILAHDRRIVNRVDDSIVRFMGGAPRILRRARGYAPAPIALPSGFESGPAILAVGGELKNTFCLTKDGRAVLSPHLGDLEDASVLLAFERTLEHLSQLTEHVPAAIAVDLHAGYLSSQHGRNLAGQHGLPLIAVQHHHAHLAACLAENGVAVGDGPILGIALDGLGLGNDGTIWGGEFFAVDYRSCQRLACLKPVPLPGGTRAVMEPWRNLYAHLESAMGMAAFHKEFYACSLAEHLAGKPTATLAAMVRRGLNSPPSSSCGRLFDAVAVAIGLCRDAVSYEAEPAMRLEALAGGPGVADPSDASDDGYPFATSAMADGLTCLDPTPMWWRLCQDVRDGVPPQLVALRFHRGLACAVADLATTLARGRRIGRIALSGGCFQNRVLAEGVISRLQAAGLEVLFHARVPANDGGLSLGQAAVAAARLMDPG